MVGMNRAERNGHRVRNSATSHSYIAGSATTSKGFRTHSIEPCLLNLEEVGLLLRHELNHLMSECAEHSLAQVSPG